MKDDFFPTKTIIIIRDDRTYGTVIDWGVLNIKGTIKYLTTKRNCDFA